MIFPRIAKPRGMVLAAGLGTRLRPLTDQCAKPAIPLLNRPLIHHSLAMLEGAGIKEIAVNLHYRPETVTAAVRQYKRGFDSKATITFSHESSILGTGGGIGKLRAFFRDREIVVCNGKIYFEQELRDVLDFHRSRKAWVTMVLIPQNPAAPFNPVLLGARDRVVGFGLRRQVKDWARAFTYTGVQILSPRVLDAIPEGVSDTVKDIYPRLIAAGRRILGFVSDCYWCECSTPSRYLANSMELLERAGVSHIGKNVTMTGRGLVMGEGVKVSEGCCLNNVVVWNGSSIGAGCRLSNVIVLKDLHLPPQITLSRVIVTCRSQDQADGPEPLQAGDDWAAWPLDSV